MVSIEDMKSCIQEWFAEQYSAVDLARMYAEIKTEIEKQLEYCMVEFTKEDSK